MPSTVTLDDAAHRQAMIARVLIDRIAESAPKDVTPPPRRRYELQR